MKHLNRQAAFTVILLITICVFGAILYSSCSKDTCKAVTCQNGGTCSGGICSCPNAIGGLDCEVVYRLLYANTYLGSGSDDSGGVYANNTLAFTAGTDSNYSQMSLVWTDPGVRTVNFAVTLTNNSPTGSNFTLGATTQGIYTFTGTGSVNSTIASATITQTDTGSNPKSVLIFLNNFNKQM